MLAWQALRGEVAALVESKLAAQKEVSRSQDDMRREVSLLTQEKLALNVMPPARPPLALSRELRERERERKKGRR